MLQTQQDKQVPAFSYEVFDRQLDHFTMMLKVLMDGWEDYSSQEMTFDIHSLCTKAARLCYLADQDLALQHTDVSHHRKEQNEMYFTSFELIITTQFTKFMKKVLALVKAGKKIEGHSSSMFSSEISTLLPKLHDLLLMDGMNQESIQLMVGDIQNTEKMIQKYHKITKFPGVRYEERLWYLIRLYCLASYLVLHFRRVCHVTDSEMTPEEAARLTEWAIQKYISEKDSNFKDQVYKYTEEYFNGTRKDPVFFDEAYDKAKYGYCGNTDWWNELYKTSFSQIYNASISGGNDRTTYYASLGMNDQKGILTAGDDKYKKYNANVNISSNITKWLNVSAKITHTYTSELHPTGGTTAMNPTAYSGLSAYSGMMKNDLSPLMPVKHPDGHYAGQGSYTNPIAIMEQGGNAKYRQNDLWMTGAVRITPIKGLVINADYTWNFYGRNANEHVRNFYDYTAVPGTENYYPWTNPSSITVSNYDDYYQAFNVFAEYSLSLAEKHNFKVLVGYNQEKKHNKYHWVGRKNLIDNDTPQINLAYGDTSTSGSESMWATNGLFFRFNYDFMGKYLFEFNGREDGSSKFAKGNRYAFFPSGSVAWRVSEEKFFEPLRSWWDNLKIRASYGSLGNQNVSGNFPYLATYGVSTKAGVLLGGTRPVAVYAPGLVSSSFTWETVNQLDLGIDGTWLNNRLSASFDWYRRDTKDMLTKGATLPSVLGTSVPRSNAANMKTTGWEVSIEWSDRLSCGLGYHIKGVLSDYQSEITKYSNDTRLLSDYYVGQKIGEIWGLVSNGLFQSDEEAAKWDQKAINGGHWSAGDVKFEDIDGDGKVTWGEGTVDKPGDRKILGNSTPRYAYGITAGADYKGFDFEMFWQGIGKRDYFGGWGGAQFWGFTDEWCTPQTTSLDYWTEDNRDAYFPKLHHYSVNGSNHNTSSRYMLNAAYLRLKNVTLGYTVPSSLLKKVGIARLRVFVQGENLLTLTPMKVKFADPETLGNMTYPINKKISVGMNLTL